jgi:hypothetical protein
MIKRKVFYGSVYNGAVRELFDKEVDVFIEEISKEECVIISYNTFSYNPQGNNGSHSIRTEIIYKEIPTRKVLIEKNK